MHPGNMDWLKLLRQKYPAHFTGASVLEIGSYNINGTARDCFKDVKRYVGVDVAKGPCVDVVARAADTRFKVEEFDTLVYLSVFEHDPNWRAGFDHNLHWIRPGGLIIICFGAEGNLRHAPEPWAVVPTKMFYEAVKSMPIKILDAFFEKAQVGISPPGAYDVLAMKLGRGS